MRDETEGRLRYWGAWLLHSVRGRATLIAVAVSASISVVALFLILVLAREYATERSWDVAGRAMDRVARTVHTGGDPAKAVRGGERVQIVDTGGTVLYASETLRGRAPLIGPLSARTQVVIDRRTCPQALHDQCVWLTGVRVETGTFGRPVIVIAANRPPTLVHGVLLTLALLPVLLLMIAAIGWWTWRSVGLALVPIEAIRQEVAHINASGTGARVPVPNTHGEIQELAETVNDTLARLDESANRERRFISDASHDLRNPISGLHTRLDALLQEDDDFDWRAEVGEALNDTERLNEIVTDLLELSRLDARAPAPVENVDLAALVGREVGRRPSRVPIRPHLENGAHVIANPLRLTRVLGNLLSNAERHALSSVEVTVRADDGSAVLEVADDGSGIAEDQRERVFERFARLPESRRRDPSGTGLGLPIAREIAESYGGTLRIEDSARGAHFVLRLPLAVPEPAATSN
ncbi:sensor histidine kinase [Actinomadura atramentaria]|uniref:sensor histidine kinase n=1 Tax=Actinomadura atramentaria TaxID=1990 RepID=UPI00035CEF7F|nr:HAMP domain-containing sensor histidine kinase [Actinomadura atramentaria]